MAVLALIYIVPKFSDIPSERLQTFRHGRKALFDIYIYRLLYPLRQQ